MLDQAGVSVPDIDHAFYEKHQAILLAYILDEGMNSDHAESLATLMNTLHTNTAGSYGISDGFHIASIGPLGKKTEHFDYSGYYRELLYQLLSVLNTEFAHKIKDPVDTLCSSINDRLPKKPPTLVHGDLWSGNVLFHEKWYLIDPACHYAHPEMDLAMMKLFGGFPHRFYTGYAELQDLDKDWENRLDIHQLFYLLVHVKLFGGGYRQSVLDLLAPYS